MPVLATRRKRFFSPARSPKPLIVRAGLARTFGSLGSFTAIIFLEPEYIFCAKPLPTR